MKLIPVYVCGIAALLFAFLFGSWLRSRKGKGEGIARIFAIVRGRVSNFWSFHYVPVIAAAVIVAAGAAFGMDWKQAAACAAGAVTALVPLIASSSAFATGTTAAFNEAGTDLKQSLRSGYRTGAVLGCLITGICALVLSLPFLAMGAGTVMSIAASFALGAALTSAIIHTGGEVYSSAYSLAVPKGDFTDRSGSFFGAGSDMISSYIIAAAAAILLADVGVATSGVTSTFTAGTAARFPLVVYACGIAGSVIGAFIQRTGIGNDLSGGSGSGCIAAGVITIAGSIYFSTDMLQSRVYAWAVATGIAAGLILSEISRVFAYDSKLFINGYKADRNLGKHSSVIFNLGTGMMSTAISSVLIIVSIGVSYMLAGYYGVALCAVGLCSITGAQAAVTGLSIVSGSASDILNSGRGADEENAAADLLDTAGVRSGVFAKSYSAFAGVMASLAAFCALYYKSEIQTLDIMSLRVFGGILAGIAAAFLLAGMLNGSVRVTGRVALRDIGRNDDETGATSSLRGAVIPAIAAFAIPVLIGLFVGAAAVVAFVISSVVTGYMIVSIVICSGMHFENTAVQSLLSLIKMMAAFSVAFLPVFMNVGGFLFG